MRHAIYIVVMLMVCTTIKAQSLPGETDYYDGSSVVWDHTLFNNGTQIGIGTTSPTTGFVFEVAGQMRAKLGNYYAESSSGDFGQLTSLFGITPPFMAGSGNYYVGSDFRVLSGVIDASSIGSNSIGAAGGVFDLDGSAGFFAGRNVANTANVLHLQHFIFDGLIDHGKTLDLENNTYLLLAEGIVDSSSDIDYHNSIKLTNSGVELLASDGNNSTTFDISLGNGGRIVASNNLGGYTGFQVQNSSNVPMFKVRNDGHVDIGNLTYTGGAYLLGVNGGVVAHSYLANNVDWADFVFHKSYKLRSLKEVKSFIETNGHLPDVPSAEEVGANGIDLAQTDAMLLMKIEELTLYLLQQQEEIEALKLQVQQK